MATRRLFSRGVLFAAALGLVMALTVALVVGARLASPVQGATLTVTSTTDGGAGSLREVIAAANPGDRIEIPSGTYTLTLGAQLTISKDLTLVGAGASNTIIQAATVPSAEAVDFRVLTIARFNVAILGVTIRHGNSIGNGGGILNFGTLTLRDSTVSKNSTITDFGGVGGGIWNAGVLTLINSTVSSNITRDIGGGIANFGPLTLTNSAVSDNTGGSGGGIYNAGNNGILTMHGSIIRNNTAGLGGGINIYSGTAILTNSAVYGNEANAAGGIFNQSDDGMILTNSTVSGNTARSGDGGGIYNVTPIILANATVSGNTASHNGGGIFNQFSRRVRLANTGIAGNTAPTGQDCYGAAISSLGHNLIGNISSCNFAPATGDLVNVDPRLGPLQDNGGPTKTHALLPGSPAIDAGDNTRCPATDQRGATRPQGRACDIGAFEVREGDVSGDGRIGLEDLRRVAAALGTSPPAPPDADVNGDRVVDALDLARGARNFGQLR